MAARTVQEGDCGRAAASPRARALPVVVLTAIFVLHFQYFFQFAQVWDTHRFSIPLLHEAYLAATLVFAAVFLVFHYQAHRDTRIVSVLALGSLVFILSSAFFAAFAFGQPLQFGVIETRRTFAFLSVYYFVACILYLRPTIDEVYLALLGCFAVYFGASLANQYVFTEFLLARDVPVFDARKLRIFNGSDLYAVVGLCSLVMYQRRDNLLFLAVFLLAAYGLHSISQTRSFLVVYLIVGLIYLFSFRPGLAFVSGFLAVTAALAAMAMGADLYAYVHALAERLIPNLFELTEEDLSQNIRTNTFLTIMRELNANHLIGLGALSQQWEDGFLPHYGEHFWLVDVGVFGELYQVGALYPFFVALLAAYILWLVRTSRTTIGGEFVVIVTLYLAVGAPLTGLYWRLGFVFAFFYLASRALASPDPARSVPSRKAFT